MRKAIPALKHAHMHRHPPTQVVFCGSGLVWRHPCFLDALPAEFRLAKLLGAAGRAAGEPAAERRPRLRCDFARSKSMKERAFQLQTHLCRSVEARAQRHITARETKYVALNDAKIQPASLVPYCCTLFGCAARAAHSLGRVVEVVWRENGPFRAVGRTIDRRHRSSPQLSRPTYCRCRVVKLSLPLRRSCGSGLPCLEESERPTPHAPSARSL